MIGSLQSLSPANRRFALLLAIPPTLLVTALLIFVSLDLQHAIDIARAKTLMATDISGRDRQAEQVRYRASTSGLAAAAFEKRVQDIFAQNRMSVSRIDLPADGDDPTALRISVTASGSLASLRRVLYALETSTPLVLVQSLQVERNEGDAPLAIQMGLQAEARIAP